MKIICCALFLLFYYYKINFNLFFLLTLELIKGGLSSNHTYKEPRAASGHIMLTSGYFVMLCP